MKLYKDKIEKYLFYIFLILPSFKPICFTVINPTINNVFNMLLLINFLIILLLVLRNKKISKINIFIFLFLLVHILSTLFNKGNIHDVLIMDIKILSLCMLIDLELRENTKEFLLSFEFVLYTLVIINLFTIFLYPEGMYVSPISGYQRNWFLGFKNIHILYILPALLLSIINSYVSMNKITLRTWILLAISILSLYKVWSATSIVAIIIVMVMMVFISFIEKININFNRTIIGYIILFFSVIILRLQNLFKYLIVNILGKDLTFTGRTYIWDYVIKFIKEKPILGYGKEFSSVRYAKGYNYHSFHAHNIFLEIIYQTGFVGLIIISIIIKLIIKKLKEYKKDILAKSIFIFLIIYFVMMLMEAYDFEYFFFLFPIAYNIENIIKIKHFYKEEQNDAKDFCNSTNF